MKKENKPLECMPLLNKITKLLKEHRIKIGIDAAVNEKDEWCVVMVDNGNETILQDGMTWEENVYYLSGISRGLELLPTKPKSWPMKKNDIMNDIVYAVSGKHGAPMGRNNVGIKPDPKDKRIYDRAVPMSADGAYDKGGAYWGIGRQLRVQFTKDLSYIKFYRYGDEE